MLKRWFVYICNYKQVLITVVLITSVTINELYENHPQGRYFARVHSLIYRYFDT